MRKVVIGDIHGEFDLLLKLMREHGIAPEEMIFVGDYIDRGPKSREVLILVKELNKQGAVCLMGNHEKMMLDAILKRDLHWMNIWLINGGIETLENYGPFDHTDPYNPEYFEYIDREMIEWVAELPLIYEVEDFLVTHAGYEPDLSEEFLLWERYDIGQGSLATKMHIHGHTPQKSGPSREAYNRLNVDAGAVFYGKLGAVIIEDGNYKFISVEKEE